MHGKRDLNLNLRNAVKLLPQESDPIYAKLIRLAESRDIEVLLADLTNKVAKGLKGLWFITKGRAIITIDDSLTGDERRFVMAHELGHAVLHKNTSGNLYFRNKEYRGRMEEEADRFAGKLLSLLERKRIKLERERRTEFKPEFDPKPPAGGAKSVREYVVTAVVSGMAA